MSTIRPFKAFRPLPILAGEVAAKPYDILNSEEAREEVKGHPLSFLHVGKPEIDLDPKINPYDSRVYQKGKENLQKLISDGVLIEDSAPYLYLYSQTMGSHTQYGLVGCASVEEYRNDTIKKHELTRQDKEDDRCQHIRITNSHSGPIFLTYRDVPEINSIVDSIKSTPPENDHIASDGVRHQCWVIKSQDTISKLCLLFNSIPNLYVADGHHRTAAAARVGRERKDANPNHTGNEEYNFFLAVFFPASQLQILDYNRAVKDLYGLTEAEFLKQSEAHFEIQESDYQVKPTKKGEFGCYLKNRWYKFIAKEHLRNISDPVLKLDVSILQNYVLAPILGVADPRTDKRIDFIGGTRGLGELERHVNSGEMKIAFSLYPTSVEELMSIANTGKVMPPKSTWFEPKLRDGLFVHFF